MELKINRRKAVIIALSALVVAAAVAIPVGIVYGVKSDDSSSNIKQIDFTTDSTKNQTWVYDAANPTPPAFPEDQGYNADDYDTANPVLLDTNVKRSTEADPTKPSTVGLFVTYEYSAKTGPQKLRVTYPVVLTKAVAPAMDPATNTAATLAVNYAYGSEIPAFDFAARVNGNFKGYVPATTGPVYRTAGSAATELTLANIKTLNKDAKFTATYSANLNTDFYTSSGPNSGTFVITYTVVPLQLTPPVDVSAAATLKFEADFTPVPAPDAAANYKLDTAAPVTSVLTQPAGASNTPAPTKPIVVADVSKYELGTVFTYIYHYVAVNDNFTGQYNYTFTYTVGVNTATPPSPLTLNQAEVAYQSVYTANPAAPENPNGSANYVGTYVGAKVATKSALFPNDVNSPEVGVPVDWTNAATKNFNAGTVIEITYKYDPRAGYAGASQTVTQLYKIMPVVLSVPTETTQAVQLRYQDSFTPVAAPVPTGNFVLDTAAPVSKVDTRPENASQTPVQGQPVINDDVPKYEVGTVFTYVYHYVAKSANYSGQYNYSITYTIGDNTATAPTATELDPIEVPYQSVYTANPTPPENPKGSANYVGKYIGAKVVTKSTLVAGANSPEVDVPVDWTNANTKNINAGTVIQITYQYDTKPGYTPDSKTLTQLYKIMPVALSAPSDIAAPVTLVYDVDFTPAANPAPAQNFMLDTNPPMTAIKSRPADAVTTPAEGQQIVIANVSKYDPGTVFTYVYHYIPVNGNYTGQYDYTFTYTINANSTAVAPTGSTLDDQSVNYGTPPTASPNAPLNPKNSSNYVGTYVNAKVVTKSKLFGDDANSPDVNTLVDWTKASSYNAGTEIEITYSYAPRAGYTGETKTMTLLYKIVPVALSAPTVTSASKDLTFDVAFNPDVAPAAAANFKADPAAPVTKVLNKPASATKTPDQGQPIVNGDVAKYEAGTIFTYVYHYLPITANYTGQYDYTFTYTIKENVATSPNGNALDDASFVYGTPPVTNPPAPVDPKGSKNYVGTYSSAKVVTKSTLLTDANSPEKDTPVIWTNGSVKNYNVGTVIEITYSYAPKAGYSGETKNMTQLYSITPAPLTAPTDIAASRPLTFDVAFNPEVAPGAATNFKLDPAAPITAVVTRPQGATKTPAQGQQIVNANVSQYEVGTVFTYAYHYISSSPNYSGQYSYTFTYTVNLNPDVTQPTSLVVGATYMIYGNSRTSVDPAPVNPNGAKNFVGTYLSAEVTKKSTINNGISPEIHTPVIWTDDKTKTYNSGTVITWSYRYDPRPGYTGTGFTITQDIEIRQAPIYFLYIRENTDTTNYVYGADPTLLPQKAPYNDYLPQGDWTQFLDYSGVAYYGVELTGVHVPWRPGITIDGIRALKVGEYFTVIWSYTIKPNSNYYLARNKDNQIRDSVANITPYQVQAIPASTPPETLGSTSFAMGHAPVKPTAPVQEGYTGSFTSAVVSKAPLSDIPALNTPVDDWVRGGADPNKDLNTFAVGTEITVTYTYKLDATHSGKDNAVSKQTFTVTV